MADVTDPAPTEVVLCSDDFGRLVPISRESIIPALAAFGILLERDQVLLHIDLRTGLLQPPGGLIDGVTDPVLGLKQLFRASTGLTPEVRQLLLIDETYYFYEGSGYQLSRFFYLVSRPKKKAGSFVDFDSSYRPQWIKIAHCDRKQILLGYNAIRTAATFR